MRFIPVYIAAIFVLVIAKMQENPSFKKVGFVGILLDKVVWEVKPLDQNHTREVFILRVRVCVCVCDTDVPSFMSKSISPMVQLFGTHIPVWMSYKDGFIHYPLL